MCVFVVKLTYEKCLYSALKPKSKQKVIDRSTPDGNEWIALNIHQPLDTLETNLDTGEAWTYKTFLNSIAVSKFGSSLSQSICPSINLYVCDD